MRNFLLGVIVTLLVLLLITAGVALLGFMPTNADATPPAWESRMAMSALDAAMQKRAPRLNNPVPPTDENVIEGLKVYTMACAGCHGGLDRKESDFGRSFYPPAPQLILEPLDDPEWHIYYAVRTGVRYTGMPAWGKTMKEDDMWKVTMFLSRVEKLSPAVKEYWQKSSGVQAPVENPNEPREHHHHH